MALAIMGMPLAAPLAAHADEAPQQQSQDQVTVTGTVFDENNEPVIGANVAIKGSKGVSVNTNFDGNFTIRVPRNATLVISFVGYKTETLPAQDGMAVYLQPTTEQLDQLVVVGYGTQKKANLTGAVATVDVARVVDSRPQTDVVKALQGAVPGLTITTGDGGVNATAGIKIRGTGTLSNNQTSDPLIVVDGVPVDDLSFINPEDVQDISVLKDASSSAIYGTRAAFGVILITTKTPNVKDRVSIKYSNNFAWSQATTLPKFDNVPNQLKAYLEATTRDGGEQGFFGMWFEDLLPYAQAWYEQNGGKKKGYSEMRPYQSMSDVGDYYYNPELGYNLYYADWDIAGIYYNNAAPSNKHNVSIEGTSGKTQYRAAFGYDGKQDLMNFSPDKLKRYTANASISTEVFSWLKAGIRFNFANKEYESHNFSSNAIPRILWRWGSFWTVSGYRTADDGQVYDYRTIAFRKQAGPDKTVTTDTRMQAWMDITPFKDLTIHGDFTYDVVSSNRNTAWLPVYGWNTWTNVTTEYPLVYMSTQSATDAYQYNTKTNQWTMNVYATYDHTFAQDFNLKVMAGATAEEYNYNYFGAGRDVLLDNDKPYLNLTTGGADGTSVYLYNTITSRATAGFFGRINFDYKGIYLLEANGRYDGSSRFPAGDQWAFFPSFSVGYRFSEEPYFKSLKDTQIWTNGKIRASYGHIGNEAVGEYMFLSTINRVSSSNVSWLNSSGAKVNQMYTPDLVSSTLTWERVITTDIGLDLGFFNNSLNFTFDWFQRDTKDMLAPGMQMPDVLGADAPYVNEGQLRTRGWEIGVNWNHSYGDWDVYASANIYDGKTKIVKYNNESGLISGFNAGYEYGAIWGFETDRYFEESDFNGQNADGSWNYKAGVADQTGLQTGSFVYGPGDIKFKDLNGDGVIDGGKGTVDDHGDLKIIGNTTPRYEYSFRLGASWKGFDIDAFFQGVGKRDMWKTSNYIIPFANNDDAIFANQMSYNQIIYNEDGTKTYLVDQSNKYPALFGGNYASGTVTGLGYGSHNFYPQSKYLMNMAYLRFKTLTIGYTLPAFITQKALIQKARVYFSADNLCLLYNGMRNTYIDPEIGSTWTTNAQVDAQGFNNDSANGYFGSRAPINRTFSFGIQITF